MRASCGWTFRYLAMALDHAVMRKGFSRPLVYPPLGLV
jgi:hypothetical protein